MRITYYGKIGIGTTTPKNKLQVNHTGADTDNGIMVVRYDPSTLDGDNLGGIGFDSTDGNVPTSIFEASAYIAAYAAEDHTTGDKGGDLVFGTAPINQNDDTVSSERMRILDSGKVGIGTTTPPHTLTVQGDISASGKVYSEGSEVIVGGGVNLAVNGSDLDFEPGGPVNAIYFNGGSAGVMGTPAADFTFDGDDLSVGGDIIAFASDKRLKENIVLISNPIEKIKQLRGVTYDWKDSTLNLGFRTKRQYNEIGLIAQELEKVIPQAVTRAPFDNTDNPKIYVSGSRIDGETEPYKTIKMEKVIPLLIEGIKDQQKQIDELKELVTKLINK